jgi:hypothetical protein
MELQKDKELVQDTEPKELDLDAGVNIDLNIEPSVLKSIKEKHPDGESLDTFLDNENFKTNQLDLDQVKNETEQVLSFISEDFLPEIIIKDEILKLLKEE